MLISFFSCANEDKIKTCLESLAQMRHFGKTICKSLYLSFNEHSNYISNCSELQNVKNRLHIEFKADYPIMTDCSELCWKIKDSSIYLDGLENN